MLSEEELKSIHDNLGIQIKDKAIGLTLTGSKSLPGDISGRDIDLIIGVANENIKKELRHELSYVFYKKNRISIKKKYNFCINIRVVNIDSFYSWPSNQIMWGWISHYQKPLFGEQILDDVDLLSELNIIKNKLREGFLAGRKRIDLKGGYHIYATICLITNKSFDFTDEQISIIKLLHEKSQDVRQYVKYCLSELDISMEEFIKNVPTYREYFETNNVLFYREIINKEEN